jgi:hypothetical protein
MKLIFIYKFNIYLVPDYKSLISYRSEQVKKSVKSSEKMPSPTENYEKSNLLMKVDFDEKNIAKALMNLDFKDNIVIYTGPGSYSLLRSICSFFNGYFISQDKKINYTFLDLDKIELTIEQFQSLSFDEFLSYLIKDHDIAKKTDYLKPVYLREI